MSYYHKTITVEYDVPKRKQLVEEFTNKANVTYDEQQRPIVKIEDYTAKYSRSVPGGIGEDGIDWDDFDLYEITWDDFDRYEITKETSRDVLGSRYSNSKSQKELVKELITATATIAANNAVTEEDHNEALKKALRQKIRSLG